MPSEDQIGRYDWLRNRVGGYLQFIKVGTVNKRPLQLVINEEPFSMALNQRASIYLASKAPRPTVGLLGDVVLMMPKLDIAKEVLEQLDTLFGSNLAGA